MNQPPTYTIPYTQYEINMQNEPNLNRRYTQYNIRNTRLFMQNKPNLKTYMPQGIKLMYLKEIVMCLKAPKRTQFHSQRLDQTRKKRNFTPNFCLHLLQKYPKYSKKIQKNAHFSTYFTRLMRLFFTFSQVFRSRLPLLSTVLCKTNPI